MTKQIQAMENLINEGVDAISINFIDAAAFGPTMAKAAAANIPVICLHSKIEGCAAMLGFDERYTGKIVGEYAAELLKARYNGEVKGEVANLQGLLGQGLNTDRSGGFTDVMAQYPGVKVVAQEPTSWDPTKAVSITENWMTAYPNLDLIYGNSDSLTVPAAGVVDRAGKQDQVLIVSVDGTEPGLEAVKSGVMESTVLLAPQYSGFWKAYFPFLVATKEDDRKEVLIQGVLVTKDNVDAALKLAERPGRQDRRTSRSRSRWSTSSPATDQYGIDRSRIARAVALARSTMMAMAEEPVPARANGMPRWR